MTTAPAAPITLADLPGRPCPIAASLELVGERWSLLVVRELSLGFHRFTDIVAGTGAPRDRIAARLKALVEAGVVERRQYQSGPDRFEYHLTESGRALRAGPRRVAARGDGRTPWRRTTRTATATAPCASARPAPPSLSRPARRHR